jgi:hypothetical protein
MNFRFVNFRGRPDRFRPEPSGPFGSFGFGLRCGPGFEPPEPPQLDTLNARQRVLTATARREQIAEFSLDINGISIMFDWRECIIKYVVTTTESLKIPSPRVRAVRPIGILSQFCPFKIMKNI